MNEEHQVNRQYWNEQAVHWKALRDEDQLWRHIPENPALGFIPRAFLFINKYVGQIEDSAVGVLGSGDNYAAFALAAMGAYVTSVDFSAAQLDVAAERAELLGLAERMRFVETDITQLDTIPDECFDLAISTNGVQVWLSDLRPYFREVERTLRPGGTFIGYDVHPFQRPWKHGEHATTMAKPYFERIVCDDCDANEYHWTMGDILNAMIKAGLALLDVKEDQARDPSFWQGDSYATDDGDRRLLDWHHNPRAGLPVWLTLAARRP